MNRLTWLRRIDWACRTPRIRHCAFLTLLLLGAPGALVAQQEQAGPRPPERVRIGIAPVRNLTTAIIAVHVLAVELRQELISKETEAELLIGRTPGEIEEDAEKKDCDYILYAEVDKMRQIARGKTVAGADRVDDPNRFEPSGTFVGQLHVRLMKRGNSRPRFDQRIHSVGGGVTAQHAALSLTHSVRPIVLRALGVK